MKLASYKKLFGTAKTRSGRRPISVATLLKKHEKGDLRKRASLVGQTEVLYRDGDRPDVTGAAAKPPRKKGDVPDRDGGDLSVKADSRQDVSDSPLVDSSPAYPSIEKGAERLSLDRALGDEARGWEAKSRADVGTSPLEKHVGFSRFTRLSDISTEASQDAADTTSKTATIRGFVNELLKIGAEEKPPEKTKAWGTAAGAYGGAGLAAYTGQTLGNSGLNQTLEENPEVFQKVLKSSPVPVHQGGMDAYARHTDSGHMRSALQRLGLTPGAVNVRPTSGAALLSHEIGHAHIDRTRLGRAIQGVSANAAGVFALPLGAVSGLATGGSDDKNVRRAGVLAPALATLPQLAAEGAASISGLRSLKRHGASPAYMRDARKQLAKTWGSYAGRAAGAPLGALAAQSVQARDRSEPKVAGVSDQAVMQSVDRLDKLKRDAPTVGQLGRAAGVGAVLGPVASLTQRAIAGRGAAGPTYRGVRDLAASAASGAIAGGLVPTIRRKVDQSAEKKTIKNYLNQQGQ